MPFDTIFFFSHFSFYLWWGDGNSQVVGWPPIRAYRMNSLVNQSKVPNVEEEEDKGVGGNEKKEFENSNKKINCGNNHKNDDNNNSDNNNNISSAAAHKEKTSHLGFTKVNMDGLPIGRKLDLNAHTCYESLAQALEDMFFKSTPSINSICKAPIQMFVYIYTHTHTKVNRFGPSLS